MNNRFSGNDYRGAFAANNYPKAVGGYVKNLVSRAIPQPVKAATKGMEKLTGPTGKVAGGAENEAIVKKMMAK